MRKRSVRKVIGIAIVATAFMAIMCWLLMLLWNALMPDLFGLKSIGYWQALGMLVLSRFLFGGLGLGRGPGHWRHRMRERFEGLTPEEREKFMEAMQRRCGPSRPPADTPAAS